VYCPESGNTVDVLSVTQILLHDTNVVNDPTTAEVTETATHLAQRLHALQTELHTLGQRESREQASNNNKNSSGSETSLTHKRRVQAMLVELHDVATRLHDVSPLIAPIDAGFLMQMYMNAPQHTQRASLATRNGKQRQRSVQALMKSQKRKRKQVSRKVIYLLSIY
jgi:hypothetical protein